MKLIVRPSPKWRFRFGDLIIENAKAISLIAGANAPAKPLFMAAVRGRSSDLPVSLYRFANLRTAATLSFGDD
ncbi:hypothetical protein CNN82_07775 [Pseudomonas frederiksbergensis]|jgi:hypothetical protein|uniref:Uncharacterized protein n=1 Tax=Pseudomonas frederiksbergensis TaxID=104087 RepID=A0AB33EAY7_9PSED|nr:hypothetical protein CNN82_07775 [Pseudomonas frederiksbergensis]